MRILSLRKWIALGIISIGYCQTDTDQGSLKIQNTTDELSLQVTGDEDDVWIFESSTDLVNWNQAYDLSNVNADHDPLPIAEPTTLAFYRARLISDFYDPSLIRTISLTFEESNWQEILQANYSDASNLVGNVSMNGIDYPEVGIRYKGNTSYFQSGEKKSIAIEMDYVDADLELEGYNNLNFNNALNDETLMREALYFNSIKEYAITPNAGFIKVIINDENWGVYSNAQQQDSTLIEEWFDDNDGDRWKSPSGTGAGGGISGGDTIGGAPPFLEDGETGGEFVGEFPPFLEEGETDEEIIGGGFPPFPEDGKTDGEIIGGGFPPFLEEGGGPGGGGIGGGGGFESGDGALLYLGDDSATYEAIYELKLENSVDPWAHLIAASKLLSETESTAVEYREIMDTAFAVDRWLWFLAAENIFTDDDSYWNKGADYQIYYEPDSGQLHPIEHDGNEAFTTSLASLDPMHYEDNENRPIISKFLSNPELRQRYLAHYRTIIEERFNPDYLNTLIEHYKSVISDDVELDTKKGYTFAAFETDITALKAHIQDRYDYLLAHDEVAQTAPTISNVSEPDSPLTGETVFITATVEQNATDGVASVNLYYRQGGSGSYTDLEMLDDGLHNDGATNDGIYGGEIPSYLSGQKVRYYIEAISANEHATASYNPVRAELAPYKYEVETQFADTTSIVINEFMSSNDTILADPQGDYDDWIELYNLTDEEVDLSGMYLSDNRDNPRKWEIPEGTTIDANGYLIIWADEDGTDDEGNENPGLHANFKLSASGEEILLVDTDANSSGVLDFVEYTDGETDISIGRSALDSEVFEAMTPTPGSANQ